MDIFKQPPRMSVHQLLWYFLTPLSPTPPTSAVKSPENTEENPDYPEPATGEDIQNGILLLLAL